MFDSDYPPKDSAGGAAYYRQGQIDLLARLREQVDQLPRTRMRGLIDGDLVEVQDILSVLDQAQREASQ